MIILGTRQLPDDTTLRIKLLLTHGIWPLFFYISVLFVDILSIFIGIPLIIGHFSWLWAVYQWKWARYQQNVKNNAFQKIYQVILSVYCLNRPNFLPCNPSPSFLFRILLYKNFYFIKSYKVLSLFLLHYYFE